jgi:hypothetical protein
LTDDHLPVEQPTPYPTALARSIPEAASEDRPAEPISEQPEPQPSAKNVLDPIPVKTPPIAPLATVPSPLRMNRTPEPIPVEVPAANVIADSSANDPAAPAQHLEKPVIEPGTPATTDSLPPIVSPSDIRPTVAEPPSAPVHVSTAPAAPAEQQQLPEERLQAIDAQRDVLIAMLEDEIRQQSNAGTSEEQLPRLEQELRLLYAGAERVDDAAQAIDSLSPAEREAYKHLMFGLCTWLSPEESRRAPLRNARVMRSLREAASELSAASKLDLRNLAFCEQVRSYGWFTEFARNEFLPKQELILYVEVDNFAALEKSPTSFETELQGHYQIFDSRGNIVAERKLPLDREVCRNYRRDYFLAYPIYMPDSIPPGHYRLELTVEDLKAAGQYQGRKFGEAMIEFAIRG